MNQRRTISLIFGILLFLAIFLSFVYLRNDSSENYRKDVEIDEMILLIKNKKAKEICFRQSQAELKDLDGNSFTAIIGSDLMRETLLMSVTNFNAANESAPIKTSEETTFNGWGWILLINSLPILIFFVLCMLTAFYVGKISSRNKG